MSCEKELQGIARALRKESLYFSRGWNSNMLQAFIRDGGCCVYCGKPLLDMYDAALTATGEHLLPKHKYSDLTESVDNLVPACAECNRIKHDYDPAKGKEIVITEKVRLGLIRKAKQKIERKRIEDEREFLQTGKVAFEQAVAQYRKCKASAA